MSLENPSDELAPGHLFIHARLNDPMTGGPLYCRSGDRCLVEPADNRLRPTPAGAEPQCSRCEQENAAVSMAFRAQHPASQEERWTHSKRSQRSDAPRDEADDRHNSCDQPGGQQCYTARDSGCNDEPNGQRQEGFR